MSFAARPLGFSTVLGVQKPLGNLYPRDIESGANGSAAILIGSNGQIVYVGNASSGAVAWFLPNGAGVGNAYWVKFTLVSGDLWDGGANNGTLQQLSTTRSLTWTATTGTTKTAQVTVQIYSDAGGTVEVTSGTIFAYSSGTGA